MGPEIINKYSCKINFLVESIKTVNRQEIQRFQSKLSKCELILWGYSVIDRANFGLIETADRSGEICILDRQLPNW